MEKDTRQTTEKTKQANREMGRHLVDKQAGGHTDGQIGKNGQVSREAATQTSRQ